MPLSDPENIKKKLFDIAADSSYIQLIILSALSFHHLQEFWKIDRSVSIEVDFHDQLQHLVLCGVLALHIVQVNPASSAWRMDMDLPWTS